VDCGPAGTCAGCLILDECVAPDTADPTNPCQVCDPARDPSAWSNADGATCDDGAFCTEGDVCQTGTCSGTPRVCDDGVGCNGIATCDEATRGVPPRAIAMRRQLAVRRGQRLGADACQCVGCLVNGQCFATGVANPANSCQICDPFRSATSFSAGADPFCGSCPRRWGNAIAVPGVNSPEADSQATMTADQLRLCFLSGRAGGLGGQDIWCAARASSSAAFDAPVNQASVNSPSNESNPTLSADGLELIFSSNRPGGAGAGDIYRSSLVQAAGAFGAPEPISNINTELSELGASLLPDGLTLYFHASVDGTPEGLNIFVTTRASRNAPFNAAVAVTGLATSAAEREAGPCPDQSFMTFCTNTEPPFTLVGASRLPGGGSAPLHRSMSAFPRASMISAVQRSWLTARFYFMRVHQPICSSPRQCPSSRKNESDRGSSAV
jgi:hypothetical protein